MKKSIWYLFPISVFFVLAGCSTPTRSVFVEVTPSSVVSLPATFEPTSPSPVPIQISATIAQSDQSPTITITTTLTPELTRTITPTLQLDSPYDEIFCAYDGCTYRGHFCLARPIPVEFNDRVEVTYRYGGNQSGLREEHHGVEFTNAYGTPIIASADGEVIVAGTDDEINYGKFTNFYGNLIIIQHEILEFEKPIFTLYGHLSSINVETGDIVNQGDLIGAVGKSGSAVGSHLHFEVRIGENSYESTSNPELWLIPDKDQVTGELNGGVAVRLIRGVDTVYSLIVLVQSYENPSEAYYAPIYAESYAWSTPRDAFWRENLVIGNLTPGLYRVSTTRKDVPYRKLVQIESGQLSLIEFFIDS
ncbi:MAG: M23 family metallopeptidase [Anaerolineaceae bacterium]|nr:M23 family metallopeptidase [Anaerolineaceae bacterium]